MDIFEKTVQMDHALAKLAQLSASEGEKCLAAGNVSETLAFFTKAISIFPDQRIIDRRLEIFQNAHNSNDNELLAFFDSALREPNSDFDLLLMMSEFFWEHAPARACQFHIQAMELLYGRCNASNPIRTEARARCRELQRELDVMCKRTAGKPHMFLYSLPWAGTAAIRPILKSLLVDTGGFDWIGDNVDIFPLFHPVEVPAFLHCHAWPESMPFYLSQPNVKFLCLTRDPRDAVVSEAHTYLHDNRVRGLPLQSLEEMLSGAIQNLANRIPAANRWLALPDERCFKFTFEELKQDIPGMVKRIFDFVEIPWEHLPIEEVCAQHSFEKNSGRQRGEEGPSRRLEGGYFIRKGGSGDWKNHFGPTHLMLFRELCGDVLSEWGYV